MTRKERRRNQNTLTPEHIDQIYNRYRASRNEAGVRRVVTFDEIAANGWNQNIPRYVEPIAKEETISVAEAMANLKAALEEAYAAEDRLKELLREAGFITTLEE